MDLKTIAEDVGQSLLSVAPTIATVLTGGNPLAGMAVSALASWFGVKPEALTSTIAADPTAVMKLQQFAMQYQSELQLATIQANSADYQTQVADTSNARAMETTIKKYQWVPPALSVLVTIGFFVTIAVIMFTKMDASDHDILYMMLGVLATTFSQCFNFYLGSSKNEQDMGDLAQSVYQMHTNYVAATQAPALVLPKPFTTTKL